MCGPTVLDTDAALTMQGADLRSAYEMEFAAINSDLNSECTTFNDNNACVSLGGRFTNAQGGAANAMNGNIVAAYKINPSFSVGGYVDQSLMNNSSSGLEYGKNIPLFGMFGAWSQNVDGSGFEARIAAGYGENDVTMTRAIVGSSEAGTGTASLHTRGLSGVVKYGVAINDQWMASPYAGIRNTRISRSGYTEATSGSVNRPLTYNRLTDEATTVLAGVHVADKLTKCLTIGGTAGFEQDIVHHVGQLSASGLTFGQPSVDFNSKVRETRAVASLDGAYKLTEAQQVVLSVGYRQEAYTNASTATASVAYQIGF